MTVLLYRVTFPKLISALGDAPTNDFVFNEGGGAIPFAATDSLVESWYNGSGGGQTNPLGFYMNKSVSRAANAVSCNVYDITAHLDGSSSGAPVHFHNFTLSAAYAGSTPMPDNVAVVIDHHADLSALSEFGPIAAGIPTDDQAVDEGAPATHTGRSRPRSRLRGRVYVPCLTANTAQEDGTSHEARLADLFMADLVAMSHNFASTAHGVSADWAIWSRRNASVTNTVGGWVRDTFSTSRRRGRENAPKQTFTS